MIRVNGQATIELIVVFLGFAALFFGLFELTRLYQAKHALNAATFAAARAGALNHGKVGSMNAELANQMGVLSMAGQRSAQSLATAKARAMVIAQTPGLGIETISPTLGRIADLDRPQWMQTDGHNAQRWQSAVPNDNPRWRPRVSPERRSDGVESPLNLQDANVLRVRSHWCHRLITPALDRAIAAIASSSLLRGARQRICEGLSEAEAASGTVTIYVAINSDATVRLQSPLIGTATVER